MAEQTRRDFTKRVLGLIVGSSPIASFVGGCGTSLEQPFTSPDQVLSNPDIQAIVSVVRGYNLPLHLSRELNPPILVGTHSLAGSRIYPNYGTPLSPGKFIWSNQTPDNRISTRFSQIGPTSSQTGSSSYGEIVRGNKRDGIFTTYSRLDVTEGACREDAIDLIVDGRLDNGKVNAIYIAAVRGDCFVPTAGRIDLELTGPARIMIDPIEIGDFLIRRNI